jgi:PEP-CTERM motif-containing protein
MKNLSSTVCVLTVIAANMLAGIVNAAPPPQPIVGSIDFGGAVTFDTTSLSTATEVMNWNSSFVLQGSGDFSSIAFGTHSVMAPQWIFNQGTPGSPSPGPATSALWSVGGFTFDLAGATVVPGQNNNFLHVTGTGTVTSTNNSFAATPGLWSFTVSDSNGQDQTTFGFQANTTAVPEPGTSGLIATGIVALSGIAWCKRKQPKAKQ